MYNKYKYETIAIKDTNPDYGTKFSIHYNKLLSKETSSKSDKSIIKYTKTDYKTMHSNATYTSEEMVRNYCISDVYCPADLQNTLDLWVEQHYPEANIRYLKGLIEWRSKNEI